MFDREMIKWIAGGGSTGLVLVIGWLLQKGFVAWKQGRLFAIRGTVEAEAGVNTEWRKFAGFLQRRVEALEKRVTEDEKATERLKRQHEADIKEARRVENQLRRQYNALRMRCDRYEEAMRQASIPFQPFDSDDFEGE